MPLDQRHRVAFLVAEVGVEHPASGADPLGLRRVSRRAGAAGQFGEPAAHGRQQRVDAGVLGLHRVQRRHRRVVARGGRPGPQQRPHPGVLGGVVLVQHLAVRSTGPGGAAACPGSSPAPTSSRASVSAMCGRMSKWCGIRWRMKPDCTQTGRAVTISYDSVTRVPRSTASHSYAQRVESETAPVGSVRNTNLFPSSASSTTHVRDQAVSRHRLRPRKRVRGDDDEGHRRRGRRLGGERLRPGQQGVAAARLLHQALAGDDADVPLIERDDLRALLNASTVEERLATIRAAAAARLPAIAPVHEAFRGAAATDPKLAEDCTRIMAGFAGHLRPGLSIAAATDIFWMLVAPR